MYLILRSSADQWVPDLLTPYDERVGADPTSAGELVG
jgi:hypothetical protein